jgi:thioredoxin reductase (NADPH)
VGGGPAGLTAATYLARYRRAASLMDDGESRAVLIPESHNYPGFKGIAGTDLLKRLRDQALMYGAVLERGRVDTLDRAPDGGFIATSGVREIRARYVLLATGLIDEKPQIHGISDDGYREAIRFCPICDGYEATDRRIGVLGSLAAAGKKALFLRTYARELLLFVTDEAQHASSDALTAAGVIVAGRPVHVEPIGDKLTVTVEGGARYDLDVLYPALGCNVRSELATKLGAVCSETGNLKVDHHLRTTVAGLYAAGDVVTDLHQLTVATGHAAIAATDIHNELRPNWR